MQSNDKTVEEYLKNLPINRIEAVTKLHNVILKNIPKGFEGIMNYGMPGFVVPHSIYPNGYHCDPKLPLPFIGYASQKNFVTLYHCRIYTSPNLLDWFKTEIQNHSKTKLDVRKSCIRLN